MNNKIPQQKTFMILKEAETLDYIPLKVTSSMGLMHTPVFSIFRFFRGMIKGQLENHFY